MYRYALVIWLGSGQYNDTWFPPLALFDVLRPFKAFYPGSVLMTLASYMIIRQTGLHAIFCLALTCRESWDSRKRFVAFRVEVHDQASPNFNIPVGREWSLRAFWSRCDPAHRAGN